MTKDEEIEYWKKQTDCLGRENMKLQKGSCETCGMLDFNQKTCKICLGYTHRQS